MALYTAKICKEKSEKRANAPVKLFDAADYSGIMRPAAMANFPA